MRAIVIAAVLLSISPGYVPRYKRPRPFNRLHPMAWMLAEEARPRKTTAQRQWEIERRRQLQKQLNEAGYPIIIDPIPEPPRPAPLPLPGWEPSPFRRTPPEPEQITPEQRQQRELEQWWRDVERELERMERAR